jgi:O-antigen/teichoic acid export membrane protein
MPAASGLRARAQQRLLWKYFWTSTFAIAIASIGAATTLLIFSESFMALWMGPLFAERALPTFRILILVYALVAFGAPAYQITLGIGSPSVAAGLTVAGGLASIALIYILSSALGLAGAALGNSGYLVTLATVVFVIAKLRPVVPDRKTSWRDRDAT